MRIPFEHDTSVDPIAPTEPTDQAAAETDIPTLIVDPPADNLTADDLTDPGLADPPMTDRPDDAVAPPMTPPSTADVGAAQRRITMQLYSRMVTDLKVLTGDKRLPTDAEIDEALNRAVRALGLPLSRPASRPETRYPALRDIPFAPDRVAPAIVFPAGPGAERWGSNIRSQYAPDGRTDVSGLQLDQAMLKSVDEAAAAESGDAVGAAVPQELLDRNELAMIERQALAETARAKAGGPRPYPRELIPLGAGGGDIAEHFLSKAGGADAPDWLEGHIGEFALDPTVENFTRSGEFDRIAAVRDQARIYAEADETRTNTRLFADRLTEWLDGHGYGPDIVVIANPRGYAARTDTELGSLSSHYETGGRGPGTISTGRGDRGGVSYGSYQLASNTGSVKHFVESDEARAWAEEFRGLRPGTPAFSKRWREIATRDPDTFQAAQHAFIQRTHYRPVVVDVLARKKNGLDFDTRSDAVRNAVWSTSVQHGGAAMILNHAVNATDGALLRTDPGYDAALIDNIYDRRTAYVSAVRTRRQAKAALERNPVVKKKLLAEAKQLGDIIKIRYPSERVAAQQMLRDERRRSAQ